MKEFVIETRKLTKCYGEQTVVKEIDLHVRKGEIYGLLGRNGAGKTTLMKMILGLTPETSGEVELFGRKLRGQEKQIYPQIGAMIEAPGFYPNLTGTENLEIFARLKGLKREQTVKRALAVVGLPYQDKKLFGNYSLGMKQKVYLIAAFLSGAGNLILDEPFNGLDPESVATLKKLLIEHRDAGNLVLFSAHNLDLVANFCDDVVFIDKHRKIFQLENPRDFAQLESAFFQNCV